MLLIKPKHSLPKSFTHKKRDVLESQISTKIIVQRSACPREGCSDMRFSVYTWQHTYYRVTTLLVSTNKR